MCQCRFINYNTCTQGGVFNKGCCVYVSGKGMWEISVLSIYCEPEITGKSGVLQSKGSQRVTRLNN